MPTLLDELDANRGPAGPYSLNYDDEGSPIVHHATRLDLTPPHLQAQSNYLLDRESDPEAVQNVLSRGEISLLRIRAMASAGDLTQTRCATKRLRGLFMLRLSIMLHKCLLESHRVRRRRLVTCTQCWLRPVVCYAIGR